ncbi:MAG: AMP-binding protein [Acidimicrobiia bacterium]
MTDQALLDAIGQGMTVAYWAARQPDVAAIISESGNRSFAELNANINRLVRALRDRGVDAGDSMAIMMANRPEFAESNQAALRSGLRYTTINWHLSGEEAGYILNDCEAKVFVADVRFADAAQEALQHAPNATVCISVGGEIEGFETFESVIEGQDGSDVTDPEIASQMLYTSGTTGRPKGVSRARSSDVALQQAIRILEGPTNYVPGESVHLVTGPLYHAAPLGISLNSSLIAGAGVVLMDGWDTEGALALIEKHQVTHSHMVPTMFHRMLSLPEETRQRYNLSSLRYVNHGAAPCPVSVKQRLIEWLGPIVHEYYAATEGSGTTVDSHEWLTKPGTVGKPPTDDHVVILDENGEAVGANETGTIYLKTPEVGRFEYYKDADKTARSYSYGSGAYFTLGDIGYMDEDGYLFLTDRDANLIISGGVNIYPAEAEAELIAHPAVGDVAVIGIPDDEWGELVIAIVEPQPGVQPSDELAAELIAFVRERLAHYKCPRRVEFRDELPRHDNGKLYKRLLRDEYRQAARKAVSEGLAQ